MAAYDEMAYQSGGEHPYPYRDQPRWSGEAEPIEQVFALGIAVERARITELLSLEGERIPVLMIHGEWRRRVSLHKWEPTEHVLRCQELRAQARQVLAYLRSGDDDAR
jgi:hypothetical protein